MDKRYSQPLSRLLGKRGTGDPVRSPGELALWWAEYKKLVPAACPFGMGGLTTLTLYGGDTTRAVPVSPEWS